MQYDYITDGSSIYDRSFAIIRAEAHLDRLPDDLAPVAARMVHATGQTDIVDDLGWSDGLVTAARAALLAGAPVLCDSTMVATGITRSRLPRENQVVCLLQEPATVRRATERGITKTMAAVELWAERPLMASRCLLDGAVVAIGNAPTSLFRLLEVVRDTGVRPAAVIGCPVGFVGAAESKQALAGNDLGLDYLTLHGRRGGSAVTVAAVNALASSDERGNRSLLKS